MNWWHRLLRRRHMEEQLDKELRFHLEEHTNDLIGRGYAPEEARRQARLTLGGPEQVKEGCRDARGTRWVEELIQDVRYALRTLRQKPGFAGVALFTLALGCGATTVMFTLIDGVLLTPLPYREPARLVRLQERTDWATPYGNLWGFSFPNFLDCQRQSRSVEMAAMYYAGGIISSPGAADYVDGFEISSALLSILGVSLSHGRAFLPEEDRPGGTPVAIISHDLWRQRFAGNPSAIGGQLVFAGNPYIVVGILPAGFRLDGADVPLLTPIGQNASPAMLNRDAHGMRVWGRLRQDVSLARAQSELAVIGRQLSRIHPESNRGRIFVAESLRPDVGTTRSTLWLLLGAVSLVLLIGCANIASLLLARAVSRERELAMRVALGASRGRLARQCLTESAVLSFAGGGLGILLAALGMRPFVKFWPGTLPRLDEVRLNWHVLLFALFVSLLSGILFGLAPALRAPKHELDRILRAGARTIARGTRRLQASFVITEIALAMVLLVLAGMLGSALLRLSSLDPGMNLRNVLIARAALSSVTLSNPGQTRAAWQEVLERTRRVPGVQAAALVDTVPMRQGNLQIHYRTTQNDVPPDQQPLTIATSVTPDYWKVMGLVLRRGRFLTDQERAETSASVVIDDVLAQQAFGREDPLGKRLWLDLSLNHGSEPATVVGIVGHVRHWGFAGDDEAPVRAQLYYSFAQLSDRYVRRWSELMSLAVRTSVNPLNVVEPVRRVLRTAGSDQVLYEIRTLEGLADASIARQRFLLLLFGIFAGLALLLACLGIYGVLAYLANQRVPEIGVRMALGATARDVVMMLLRQTLGMVLAGVVTGVAGGLAAAGLLRGAVTGVGPLGPLTVAVVVAVLTAAASAASFLPARRASRTDPVRALRQE